MAILPHNIYTDVITVLVLLITIVVLYFKWSFRYWSNRDVTTPPIVFPFGTAKDVLLQKESFGDHIKTLYDNYKSKSLRYCGYYFLAQPQLVVFDLDLIKSIMTKDFLHFMDHIGYVNEKVDPLSGHLFSLKGLKWKHLRVKLTPTFTSGKMKMMFPTMVECCNELSILMDNLVEQQEDINIKEVVGRLTTDIIGSCAFGVECNSLKNPNSEFRKYGKKVFEDNFFEALKLLIGDFIPAILNFFNEPIIKRDVSKFFLHMVKETVDYREKNNIVRKDFLHLLIQLKNNVKIKDEETLGQLHHEREINAGISKSEEGKSLTIEELAAQAFVFFLAGFETSSTTLTFCFYELVSNIEIQEKLRKEINTILEKYDGQVTYNALMEMTYMEKCLHETLRKYPPLPVLTRECTKEYKIPNSSLRLEKGTKILIPSMAIQHDSDYYPNPEKFDPERFSPENKLQRHPYAWLPFGEGPRLCIGLRFGMMQAKLALTVLLKRYKFTLSSKTETPIVMIPNSFIPTAVGGIWLKAEQVI